jgi:hypothetical protein
LGAGLHFNKNKISGDQQGNLVTDIHIYQDVKAINIQALRVLGQRHSIRRLMPLKPLGHLHGMIRQPALQMLPVDALVERVPVGRGLVVVADPVVRDNARVKVAHDALADVVDAVLVVALVHLRDALLVGNGLGKVAHVVVLPEVVQAVELVRAHGDGEVTVGHILGELNGGEVVADACDVFSGYVDGSIFEHVLPRLVDRGRGRSFVRRVIPQRPFEPVVDILFLDALIYWGLDGPSVRVALKAMGRLTVRVELVNTSLLLPRITRSHDWQNHNVERKEKGMYDPWYYGALSSLLLL